MSAPNDTPPQDAAPRTSDDLAIDAALDADALPLPRTLRSRALRALPLVAIAALAATLVLSGAYERIDVETLATHYEALRAWVGAHTALAGLAIAGSIATIVSSGLPGGAVIVLAGGLLLGPWTGTALAMTGNLAGTSILYFAARRFFIDGTRRPPPYVAKIRDGFARNPVSFTFFIRFVPVFPIGAASIALAWLGCRYGLFLLATLVGVIPSTLVLAFLGHGLGATIAQRRDFEPSLLAEPRFAIPLAALAVLALLPVLVKMRRRAG